MSMGSDTSIRPGPSYWEGPGQPYDPSSGGSTGGPGGTSHGPGPKDPDSGHSPTGQQRHAMNVANQRRMLAQAVAQMHGIRSAASPELAALINPRNVAPSDIARMIPYLHGLITQARRGTFDPTQGNVARNIGAGATSALSTLEGDYAGLRAARASGFRPAIQAERRLARAGENRGMTQAELATKNPELYDRLYQKATRFRIS